MFHYNVMSMELHTKEFWKAFGRVFKVSLGGLLLSGLILPMQIFVSFYVYFYSVALIFLGIYGLIEACKVFKRRAAVRNDNVTREADYLFAGLRFVAILIPPAAAGACIGFLWPMSAWVATGYHG